ncbi:MAG: division/cell wall cluster transcriptional repressor MraZ [Ruminococcus sp.]|jgi:MraZ protein|nr:division/cell wall cluster transcriptional repressor MraZ [Ruminococcus sp.]
MAADRDGNAEKILFGEGAVMLNMTLKGTYTHSIDAKGRMAFPQKLRDKLGSAFIVTIGKSCLNVYSPDEWDRYCDELRTLSGGKTAAAKLIVNRAIDVETDSQGRVLITKELREYAGLSKDVTVVGVINHAEIWDSSRYNEFAESVSETDLADVLDSFAF